MAEDNEVSDGHYFELLDRVHVASSYLQMAVGEHPVLQKHPELNALYEQAVDRLEQLYQSLGGRDEPWTRWGTDTR
jgi:hypothetical protein